MARALSLREERFEFNEPFRISGHEFTGTSVLVAEVSDGRHTGLGEGAGVYYLGDDLAHMLEAAEGVRTYVEAGAGREELRSLLPAGGARNAIDCALWGLEAKMAGKPVWQLAGLNSFGPLATTMTIGIDRPEIMAREAAVRFGDCPMIKLKLDGNVDRDTERVRQVRTSRPDAWLGVDANQGYDRNTLAMILPVLAEAGVQIIEQPCLRGHDDELDAVERIVPFAADESVCSLAEVDGAVGRFDMINIKLDKCGGLTEALAIAARCRQLGLGVMVGNMMGSSLSMAPSMVVGQLCDLVDLDGPTFLAQDRPGGVTYANGIITMGDMDWGLLS